MRGDWLLVASCLPPPLPNPPRMCVKDRLSQGSLPEKREGCLGTFMPQGYPSEASPSLARHGRGGPAPPVPRGFAALKFLPLWAEPGELGWAPFAKKGTNTPLSNLCDQGPGPGCLPGPPQPVPRAAATLLGALGLRDCLPAALQPGLQPHPQACWGDAETSPRPERPLSDPERSQVDGCLCLSKASFSRALGC